MSSFAAASRIWSLALALAVACAWVSCGAAWAQSPPAAVSLHNTAVNAQNNSDFDAASGFWDEFLEKYPDDPLAGNAHHYSGTCKLQLGQFDAAATEFQEVIENHPDSSLLEESYLNLAWCQYSLAQAGDAASYAVAAETFATLAEKYPESDRVPEARFFQGESLYQAGQKEESLAAYKAALAAEPGPELQAKVLYALGSTEQELGQNEAALATYGTFLTEFPEHALLPDVKLGQAQALLQSQRWAEAETLFAEAAAVEGFSRTDFALNQQAHCAAQQEKYVEAADLYANLAEQYPESSYAEGAAASAGAWYFQAEDYEKAEPWLARAAEQGGAASAEAAHWLCQAYMNSGRAEEALKQAETALTSAGDAPFAVHLQLDKADALDALEGRREEALAAYRELVEANPDSALAPRARYNAAFAAMALGQHAEGQADAEAFLENYPEHALVPDVKYVQAECVREQGQLADAEALYADLVANYPEHSELEVWQSRLGLVYYAQEKYEEVVDFLAPLADSLADPIAQAEALYLLGASQFYTLDYPAAEATLSQVISLEDAGPQADDALLLLARAQREQMKSEAAVASATKLIEDFPQSPLLDQAYYWRADMHKTAGNEEGALADYEAVLNNWPDSAFVPYSLRGKALLLMKQEKFPEAGEAFTTILTEYPNHELAPVAYRNRAVCRQWAREWQGVIEDIEAYLAAAPEASDRTEAIYTKGLAQVGLEQYEAAAETFASIVPEDPTTPRAADIMYQLAWAHQYGGDQAAALEVFTRLASEHPEDSRAAEAHYHVGQSLYDEAKYAEAIEEYSTAKELAAGAPLAEKAAYKLGWSHYQLEDYPAALEQFSWQLENFAGGSLAKSGRFMEAECQFSLEDYEAALEGYAQISSDPPADEASKMLVLLHAGQCAGQLEKWEEASDWLGQLIEQYPDSAWLPQARYELGWAQQNLQQYDEALKTLEPVADLGTDVAARARFVMGEIYFAQQDYTEAIRQFQRVLYGFSDVEGAAVWQAKSGVEAGRCEALLASQSEGATRDEHIEAARKFFRGVVEKHPGTDEAAAAQTQLERLGG